MLFFSLPKQVRRVRGSLRHRPEKPLRLCLRHIITTLGQWCSMPSPGFLTFRSKGQQNEASPVAQNRQKKSLTVTSLECCCCYVDKEICKHCFLLNYKFNFNIFPIKYARSSTFFCSVQLKPTHAVIDFCPKQWKQASGDSDLINREGLHNF